MIGTIPRRLFLIVSVFAFLATGARAFEIEKTEFVVGLSDGNYDPVYLPSDVVPLLPDRACFGWRIKISGDEKLVFTREILKLPEQPEYWSGEDDKYSTSQISEDRTTAITDEYLPVVDGWVENYWCVSEGDPIGDCLLEVYFGDVPAGRFEFEIVSAD
ncbi:hypothetical protein IWQ55_003322 [Labrenzia sp. EL_208]|nr:hypothetical protein [Labrenzia sp. EL_132]MBG6203770.1 hypothetical protein [Labrenzia sp. EL_13]MBG6230106.1 hypothetical protein [Labrenzia sp. EL_208]